MAGGSNGVVNVSGEDFDREQFKRDLNLLALRVPLNKIGPVRSQLAKAKLILKMPRVKTIVSTPDNAADKKMILLAEGCTPEAQPRLRELMQEHDLEEPVPYKHTLGYEYLTADQVLGALIPKDVIGEIPTSFETIGHIAHLNLRDEQLAYKGLIGRVILDKNDRIKTVVNKTQAIENQFRVLPMEVIAGSHEMETLVIQHGYRFKLNFAEVYWNSRLENEHNRLITEVFKPTDCILDMTCGVGPFTIPAAKRGCRVLANDLNPKCVEYAKVNCKLNKIDAKAMPEIFCMDAREFVRHVTSRNGKRKKGPNGEEVQEPPLLFNHAVINLPATGLDFVDVFRGLFDRRVWKETDLPRVHCYTFIGKQLPEPEGAARPAMSDKEVKEILFRGVVERVEGLLGVNFSDDEAPLVREVRDVAPNKRMVLISFRVPAEAAFSS
ncbi:tRNA (guanine(37)-N1)-methyltransferase [Chloropicon primus]|uniref:tRNA (guanine(37)-N1)-methyltransferase n=1 Tax=Chloropicon primus TaxID=1764295 RepID=A0A5B8MNW6_9CHLO|nr:tRNA (guanine(37)-N1)-methyltransferase [Chloropicon primus]UPR01595.1 tRNA (guanine(37)-N1)-methyltransferase [Chloropicon primus]|eukprot:QDZ22378.1 tRNA (guanine(37)-N1)-methyltransferase [Chloropicon primus]